MRFGPWGRSGRSPFLCQRMFLRKPLTGARETGP